MAYCDKIKKPILYYYPHIFICLYMIYESEIIGFLCRFAAIFLKNHDKVAKAFYIKLLSYIYMILKRSPKRSGVSQRDNSHIFLYLCILTIYSESFICEGIEVPSHIEGIEVPSHIEGIEGIEGIEVAKKEFFDSFHKGNLKSMWDHILKFYDSFHKGKPKSMWKL